MTRLSITGIRFAAASERDAEAGLLGFVSFLVAGVLLVDGVTVRRTRDRRLSLSWPARRDRAGFEHPYLRPVNDGARLLLEAQILGALGFASAEEKP